MGRTMGKLAVSRALGDIEFKDTKRSPLLTEYGIKTAVVSCEPEMRIVPLIPELDEFLLLACDGVFDVMLVFYHSVILSFCLSTFTVLPLRLFVSMSVSVNVTVSDKENHQIK